MAIEIKHWDDTLRAFVPGLAVLKKRRKCKFTWYKRSGLSWSHDARWRRNIREEYYRWLAERDRLPGEAVD